MDRRLLEQTIEVARATKAFDPKTLRKSLKLAVDSAPPEGAGKVEDTVNLLGHAARKVVECVAAIIERPVEQACSEAGTPLLLASSIKRGLDVDWSDPAEIREALQTLLAQLDALEKFIRRDLPEALKRAPLEETFDTLRQLLDQDIDPDPSGGRRIRKGVAPDRRVSVEDSQMRHGRKSANRRFNGYKRHLATNLIHACAVTPANRPEGEAAPAIQEDIARQGRAIDALYVDRAYINIILVPGRVVEFDPEACEPCPLREKCTERAPDAGRTISIGVNERLQHKLRMLVMTRAGREKLRDRVGVEHRFAHLTRRQGRCTRYRGMRLNLFDTKRASSIEILETIQCKVTASQANQCSSNTLTLTNALMAYISLRF